MVGGLSRETWMDDADLEPMVPIEPTLMGVIEQEFKKADRRRRNGPPPTAVGLMVAGFLVPTAIAFLAAAFLAPDNHFAGLFPVIAAVCLTTAGFLAWKERPFDYWRRPEEDEPQH